MEYTPGMDKKQGYDFALENGDLLLVKFLETKGFDVKDIKVDSINRLIKAVNISMVEYIFSKIGGNSHPNLWSSEAPLVNAVRSKNDDMIKLVMENGFVIEQDVLEETIRQKNIDLFMKICEYGIRGLHYYGKISESSRINFGVLLWLEIKPNPDNGKVVEFARRY